ncbi:hypothetical protein T10_9882 [Trichinella papuae]|uniref:Uncharacterized protein n=1 Tax=Trichinella papuae TaxID=268474 RepID=A0A0V1MSJ1_9BILA|nr:hypothetical protein T10_9882 [Trichinella papuae]
MYFDLQGDDFYHCEMISSTIIVAFILVQEINKCCMDISLNEWQLTSIWIDIAKTFRWFVFVKFFLTTPRERKKEIYDLWFH